MKLAKNIMFWIMTGILILIIAMVAIPRIFGIEFRAVLTGSMEPDIPVGSLVVIVPTAAEDIKVGNVITFITESHKVVTHKVVRINLEKNEFITQGITNNTVDPANRYENVMGVVRFSVPVIGRVFSWVSTLHGKIISAMIIVSSYIIYCMISIMLKGKREKNIAPVLDYKAETNDCLVETDDLYDELIENGKFMENEMPGQEGNIEEDNHILSEKKSAIEFSRSAETVQSKPVDELLERFLSTGKL